jgi:hypothetical protein
MSNLKCHFKNSKRTLLNRLRWVSKVASSTSGMYYKHITIIIYNYYDSGMYNKHVLHL